MVGDYRLESQRVFATEACEGEGDTTEPDGTMVFFLCSRVGFLSQYPGLCGWGESK